MFILSLTSAQSSLQIGDNKSKSSGIGKLLQLNLCTNLLSLGLVFLHLPGRKGQTCDMIIFTIIRITTTTTTTTTTTLIILTTMGIQEMKGPRIGHLDL
jgi:hypothetical protein